jgi:hypothetical protein
MKQTKRSKKIAAIVRMLKHNPLAKAKDVALRYNCSINYAYSLVAHAKKQIAYENLFEPEPRIEMFDLVFQDSDSPPCEEVNTPDMVNQPPHYTVGGIETIDFIQAKLTPDEFRGYLKGNILKYTSRAGHKGDVDTDIGKLVWYANKLQSIK